MCGIIERILEFREQKGFKCQLLNFEKTFYGGDDEKVLFYHHYFGHSFFFH